MNPAVKPTADGTPGRTPSPRPAFRAAFTLLELLVVITILGILAALTVPVLKNLGKSSVQLSASRQLLDDLARARQLAISHRTTVYMVFVPTNFFDGNFNNTLQSISDPAARLKAFITATNLVPLQLTGYNFLARGQVGDQPGQHQWRYLDDWKSLPDGSFIPPQKFSFNGFSLNIPQWQQDFGSQIDQYWRNNQPQIYSFAVTNTFPFPTVDVINQSLYLPYVAFDYQGRLISEVSANGTYHHAYIPLALGTVSYGRDANKRPQLTTVNPSDITENPPGNSTNLSYNVIDINPQTGRASLHSFQMK